MASKNLLVLDEKAVASNRVKPSYMQKQGGASNGSADKTKSYDSPLVLKPDSVPSYKPVQTPELDKATGNETPWYERVRNTLETGTAKAADALQIGMLKGEAGLFEAAGKVAEKVGAAGGRDAVNKSPFDWLYDKADEARAEEAAVRERAYKDTGKAGQFALQAIEGGSKLATDVAVSAMAGLPTMAVTGAGAFGSGAYEAEQEGATLDQALAYGAASAGLEAGIEKLTGGLDKIYGKGLTDDLVKGLVKRAGGNETAQWALQRLANAAGEGGEEALTTALSPFLKAIYDEGKAAKESYGTAEGRKGLGNEALYSAMLGAVIGAAGDLATGGLSEYPGGKSPLITEPEQTAEAPKQEQKSPLIIEEDSTSVNTDPAQHTPVEQRVIEEYQNSVDDGLVEFMEQSVANRGTNRGRYELKPVSERAAADIKRITGVDTTGNKTVIEQRMAEHIYDRHGPQGNADQSMKDLNDFGRIQYVLDNYDDIVDGGTTTSYVSPDEKGRNHPAKTVVFSKAVNGTYYVVEAVPDTKKKTTYIVSAYMAQNKPEAMRSTDATAPAFTAEPEIATTSVVDTLPQNSPLVKETPEHPNNPMADVLFGEEKQPSQKRSQTESNTIHARDNINQAPEEATPELYYTPMSEEESLAAAQARLDTDMAGAMETLKNSPSWSNVDLDTAMLVQDALAAEARQNNNWDAYEAWRETVQAHGTEIGRSMQAFAKWSRAGRTALAEVSDYLRTLNISKERKDVALSKISGFCERLDAVDKTDSTSIKQLVLDMNTARGTGTIIKSRLGKLLDKQNADYLYKVAKAQAVAMAHDYAPVDPGRALKSWQAIAQLLKVTTTARNIGGNEVFGTVDALLGNTVGQAIDAMVSQVTGVKSVPVNNRWLSSTYRKAASDAIDKSMLEIALDVDMGSVGTKYDPNIRAFRMSGNPAERFASRLSQLLSYALNTTDQMARGGIEAETQRSLGSKNKGAVEAEKIGEVGEQMADYELFQNKSQIAQASQGLHDTFNLIGVGGKVENGKRRGGFGAGDAVMPWASVPANLGVKPIEMSPAGIASGGIKLTKLMLDAKKSGKTDIKAQNKAVMEIARGMSGVPLAVLFAELAAHGLIQKSDDEDDYDVTNARKAEGRYDTQWNLSASLRHLNGGDAAWQEDDVLVSLNWLQPINAFMEIGALFNDLKDDEDATIWDYTKAYANGSIKAFMDMPVVQGLQDMVSTFQYADSDSMVDRLGESLKSGAVGFVTGLMPGIISNAAQAIDPYQRDTSGDTFGEQLGNKVLNNIPFASQTLPEKLDVFGNPMVNENRAFDVANSLVLPGAVNEYAPSEVVDTLDRVYEATGSSNFYPDYKAPATYDYDGVEYELSVEEKRAWQQTFGKAYTDLVVKANDNDLFNDLSADRQAAVLSEIRSCAIASAREELVGSRGDKFENEYAKAMALSDPITYFSTKAAFTSASDPDKRNYAEIDKALNSYRSLDEATRKLLDSGNNTGVMDKLYEAKQSGVSTKTWYKAKDAVSALEPLPGNTGVKTYQQMQAVLGAVSAQAADVIIPQYFDSTSLMPRKYDLLRKAGVPARKIVKFYEMNGTLVSDKDANGRTTYSKKQKLIDYFTTEAPEDLRMSREAVEKIYKLWDGNSTNKYNIDDWRW